MYLEDNINNMFCTCVLLFKLVTLIKQDIPTILSTSYLNAAPQSVVMVCYCWQLKFFQINNEPYVSHVTLSCDLSSEKSSPSRSSVDHITKLSKTKDHMLLSRSMTRIHHGITNIPLISLFTPSYFPRAFLFLFALLRNYFALFVQNVEFQAYSRISASFTNL